MALGNFQEIVIAIVGAPSNDTESFLIYLVSVCLGVYMLILIFEMFRLVNTFTGGRKK